MFGWFRRKNQWGTSLNAEIEKVEREIDVTRFVQSMESFGFVLKRGKSTDDVLNELKAAGGDSLKFYAVAEASFTKPPAYSREFAYRLAPWIAA